MKFNHRSGTFISSNSAKIYYEDIGNPKNQPLVFLHGGLGNIEDFNTILPLFKQEYRIIGIDSRGHGKSTIGKKGLTYETLENDVEMIIGTLRLKKPIILGFSDGGIVALRLACFKQLDLAKLIIVGASWHKKSLEESERFLLGITADLWKKRFPKSYESYQTINSEPDFDTLVKSTVKMWVDKKESGHPNNNVKNIKCPTLIIRGENDHLISGKSSVGLSRKIVGSILINVPSCGHEVYREDPKAFITIVKRFLLG